MLALLTGRVWAYGYRYVERFLAEVALSGRADQLTDALGQWTAQLWLPPAAEEAAPLVTYYIDGHRKPVYTEAHPTWIDWTHWRDPRLSGVSVAP